MIGVKKGWVKRVTLMVLRIVALTYIGLCVFIYFKQRKLMYFPEGQLLQTPSSVGLAYDEVRITAADGVQLLGWHVRSTLEASNGVVLFFHGNAGNIGDRLPTAELYSSLGYDVVMVGYRGYGPSSGTPSEEGLYEDARAYWRYLTVQQEIPSQEIVIHGRSLGGGPASWLAAEVDCAGLILDSTFTSMVKEAQKVYPYLPVKWICKDRYDSESRIGAVGVPLLVIHSPDDESIPVEMGHALFDRANEPKSFHLSEGMHNDCRDVLPEYRDAVREFLASVYSRSLVQ